MDYRGQYLCEQINQWVNIGAALLGLSHGYLTQSFWFTFLWCISGFILSAILCIPDWSFYNRNPQHWQPPSKLPGTTIDGVVVQDENTRCGTCICGTSVHGIECDSNPEKMKRMKEQEAAALVASAMLATTNAQEEDAESFSPDAAAALEQDEDLMVTRRNVVADDNPESSNVVEVQEIKVKSGSKKAGGKKK